jgi:cytochrome b561
MSYTAQGGACDGRAERIAGKCAFDRCDGLFAKHENFKAARSCATKRSGFQRDSIGRTRDTRVPNCEACQHNSLQNSSPVYVSHRNKWWRHCVSLIGVAASLPANRIILILFRYDIFHMAQTASASASHRASLSSSWSRPAIFFHWATAIAIAIGLFAIEIRGPKGSDSRVFWNAVHIWAGTTVLSLSVLRVLWSLWHGTPQELPHSRVQLFLARLVHLALYLLIFVQPLLGIAMVNTSGSAVQLAGTGVQLRFFAKDPVAHQFLHDAHFLIGNAAFWLIGLHAFAAIVHHVVFKDATLVRMVKVSRDE